MVTNSKYWSANQVKLEATTCEKDIGVHVDDNLSFKDHIYTKINKANAVMGIIKRTLYYLDQNMFLQLFKSLVRPLIETSVAVWAPYKMTDIAELERVQRRATKQVPDLKHLEYSERLEKYVCQHWYLDALWETWSKFSRLWPVYTIMKLLPRYLRATNTPGNTREKCSLEEPGLTYERTSSQSELARCGINYQKRWLWQNTSMHSSDYWTSTGKTTPADTIIR